MVKKCLFEADAKGNTSIGFPAFGTGKLGYPLQKTAEAMFHAVHEYMYQKIRSNLQTVYFVAFGAEPKNVCNFLLEKWKHPNWMQKMSKTRGIADTIFQLSWKWSALADVDITGQGWCAMLKYAYYQHVIFFIIIFIFVDQSSIGRYPKIPYILADKENLFFIYIHILEDVSIRVLIGS